MERKAAMDRKAMKFGSGNRNPNANAGFGKPAKVLPGGSLKQRYANVKSGIDTGKSLSKVPSNDAQTMARKRGEIFRRLSPQALARMVKECGSDQPFCDTESVYGMTDDDGQMSVPYSSRRSVYGGTQGYAASVAGSILSHQPMPAGTKYLLLDMRMQDDYEAGHIATAVNYPSQKLARDQSFRALDDLKRYPQKGQYLILYAEEDRKGAELASTFVRKGWPKVYLLTGGFSEFDENYSEMVDSAADQEQSVPQNPNRLHAAQLDSGHVPKRVARSITGDQNAPYALSRSQKSILSPDFMTSLAPVPEHGGPIICTYNEDDDA